MKIRTKLILSSLVIVFVSLLVILGIVYFTLISTFEEFQGEQLKSNVSQTAKAIDDFMFTRVKDLNAFSNSPVFIIGTFEDIKKHLTEIVKAYPFYEVLSYTDTKGIILASSDQSVIGKNILNLEPDVKEEFLKTVSGGPQDVYISDIAEISQKELVFNNVSYR